LQGSSNNLFDNKKDDFSELPPNQRRKKLQGKIEEITGKVQLKSPIIHVQMASHDLFIDLSGNSGKGRPHEDETSVRVQSGIRRSHVDPGSAHGERSPARQVEIGVEEIPSKLKLIMQWPCALLQSAICNLQSLLSTFMFHNCSGLFGRTGGQGSQLAGGEELVSSRQQ
jgi:hypothetical protein